MRRGLPAGTAVAVLTLVAVTSPMPTAAEPAGSATALIEQVLQASGITRQIARMPALLEAQAAAPAADPPGSPVSIARAFQEAFRPDALRAAIVGTILEQYDEARLRAVARAFATPSLGRIVELEARAADPDAAAGLARFTEELPGRVPTAERRLLVRRLDTAMGVSALGVEASVTIARASFGLTRDIIEPLALERHLAALRELAEISAKNDTELSMLYTYRTLSDAELAGYVAFRESDAGLWFTRAVADGFLRGVEAAAMDASLTVSKSRGAGAPPHSQRRSGPSRDTRNGPRSR
jgi:hypothetical protein